MKFGVAYTKKDDDYEYIFEDQIDFIQATTIGGIDEVDAKVKKKAKKLATKTT